MEGLTKSIDLICQSRQLLPQNLSPILQNRVSLFEVQGGPKCCVCSQR